MNKIILSVFVLFAVSNLFAQNPAQKIYDTEREFEKAVAEKGINAGFIEFLTPDGILFEPNATNGCEFWRNRPPSPASLTWNPTFIDVSSNGALAYSTGNGVYRPKGKDDAQAFYSEYATVWMRQPDGSYRAAVDIGISHPEPNNETKWTSPADLGKELNEKKISAADASTGFFETATARGLETAYKAYLADDVRMLRDGQMPIVGRANALAAVKNDRGKWFFAKRSFFVGAADLAYITNTYTVTDKKGNTTGTGNFLLVWKLRDGRWQIVLDVFTANK